MKVVFLLLISVVMLVPLVTEAWAQNGPQGCQYAVSARDNTCNDPPSGCPGTTNCGRTQFTPTCSGNYTVYATLLGCTSCTTCNVCVTLYKIYNGAEVFKQYWTPDCLVAHECSHTWTAAADADLVAGETYVLYVCLRPCPTHLDPLCEDGGCSGCSAYGCLRFNTNDCPLP